MRTARNHLLLFALLSIVTQHTVAATTPAEAELLALVQRHVTAQKEFDQPTLQAVTANDYIEISPVGEVDSREKMLSFYDPAQRRPAPSVQVDEPVIRTFDQTAIVITRLTYTMSTGGQSRSFAMRASYVARKLDGVWKLVSAQYTGIRPKS